MDVMRLCPEDIEAIARRVVELQREVGDGQVPAELLTAAQVAQRFGVSRAWVYDHAPELGAQRLGTGSRPRLRFDAGEVRAALDGLAQREASGGSTHGASLEVARDARPRRRRASSPSAQLLPIAGRRDG